MELDPGTDSSTKGTWVKKIFLIAAARLLTAIRIRVFLTSVGIRA
jgi:hypothetical protein